MRDFKLTEPGKLVDVIAINHPSTRFDVGGSYLFTVEFTGEAARIMKGKCEASWDLTKERATEKGINTPTKQPFTYNKAGSFQLRFKTKQGIANPMKYWNEEGSQIISPILRVGDTIRVAYRIYFHQNDQIGYGMAYIPMEVQLIKNNCKFNEIKE